MTDEELDDGRNPDLSHRSDITHEEALAESGDPVIQEVPKDENA